MLKIKLDYFFYLILNNNFFSTLFFEFLLNLIIEPLLSKKYKFFLSTNISGSNPEKFSIFENLYFEKFSPAICSVVNPSLLKL